MNTVVQIEADNYEEAFQKLAREIEIQDLRTPDGEKFILRTALSQEEADQIRADFDYAQAVPEVKASEENPICEHDEPVKGTITIHLHEGNNGGVGFDMDENLSEFEIIGALQYTLKVVEEQQTAAIRHQLNRKRAEMRGDGGGLEDVLKRLFTEKVKVQ